MPPKTPLDEQELRLLHGQGLSDEQIAVRLGTKRETVRDRRKMLGLPTSYPVQELALDAINPDPAPQMRVELHGPTIAEYAEAMQAGEPFPPIVVFHDGTTYWPGDGWHRLAAARQLGRATIAAEVRPGDVDAAIDFACHANVRHGLRPTAADRRKAITTQLTRHPERADREIARLVGCSPATVGTRRKELEAQTVSVQSEQIAHPSPSVQSEQIATAQRERVVTRGGTTYTQKVTPRRRKTPAGAPEPAPVPAADPDWEALKAAGMAIRDVTAATDDRALHWEVLAQEWRALYRSGAVPRSRLAQLRDLFPPDQRPRPPIPANEWTEAVATLQRLQAGYQAQLDQLDPDDEATEGEREQLEAVCELDLDGLDVDLP